jgi:hypothetical protein
MHCAFLSDLPFWERGRRITFEGFWDMDIGPNTMKTFVGRQLRRCTMSLLESWRGEARTITERLQNSDMDRRQASVSVSCARSRLGLGLGLGLGLSLARFRRLSLFCWQSAEAARALKPPDLGSLFQFQWRLQPY